MAAEFPLVCPFCDELAYRKKGYRQIVLPHKIYTPRVCIMGHEFYSVEEIPYEQSNSNQIKIRKTCRYKKR